MKVLKKILALVIVVASLLSSMVYSIPVMADSSIKQTEVSKYALKWKDNKNIPYVWGGGRDGRTLEELAEDGDGTDCSGFTSLVYKHFGITIPSQSSAQKSAAKKVFYDESEAVPGDICWWEGHVAIYIGDSKIMHTNTSDPPYNYPHVSSFGGDGNYEKYKKPAAYLRMVDDVSELKPLSGSDNEDTQNKVENAEGVGSLITESDITGMPTEWSQGNIEDLPEIEELTDKEKVSLESIKEDMEDGFSLLHFILVVVKFVGFCTMVYGVLLLVAYIFDKTNNLLDISLLSIVTFGKYEVWDENLGVSTGRNISTKKFYCNGRTIASRFFIIEAVGLFLISGWLFDIVYAIMSRYIS